MRKSNKENTLLQLADSLNDAVYHLLRDRILNHELKPNERLDLKALEHELDVSRTPLKTALNRLAIEGLVDIQPRRGTYVVDIDMKYLDDCYKIRTSFELYVALCLFKYLTPNDLSFFKQLRYKMNHLVENSAGNWSHIISEYLHLDQMLHERMVERGGPARMFELFKAASTHNKTIAIVKRYELRELEAMHFEHELIFDALLDQSPERLNESLFNHLEASRIRILKHASY